MSDGEDPDSEPTALDDALRTVGVPESELETVRERVQDALGDDPRMPVTLRDSTFATVDSVEVCDGADGHECDRSSPVLIRGEDEIHVTNYGPGHSKSGRRVLCGECHQKQKAVNIADTPDLAKLYADELADLREQYPDILGDVDIPMTDGGADLAEQDREDRRRELYTCPDCGEVADAAVSIPDAGMVTTIAKSWVRFHTDDTELNSDDDGNTVYFHFDPEKARTAIREDIENLMSDLGGEPMTDGGVDIPEDVETEQYRGPQQYPAPGGWTVNMVEMEGVSWELDPDTDDEGYQTAAARAHLLNDAPEDRGGDPHHSLTIDGDEVLTFRGDADWTEGGLWRQVHDALADADPDHEFTLPEDASDDPEDGEDADRALDEFATDGGVRDTPGLTDVADSQPAELTKWEQMAHENVQKWGLQPVDALLLAMGEEMGELAEVVLSWNEYTDQNRRAEDGRDLIRRMADLGGDIQDHLETVSEDANGDPVPTDERPNYLTPPEGLNDDLSERLTKSELDDLMALGYQFLWALETADGGTTGNKQRKGVNHE